jgi:hypothetical protein
MPTLAMLLSLAALGPLLQAAPSEQSRRLTLDLARQIVREEGAHKAAASGLDPYWGQLLDAIASGASGWRVTGSESASIRTEADP